MKNLYFLLCIVSLVSCRQYQYAFDYFKIENPEEAVWLAYQKVLSGSKQLSNLREYKEFLNINELYKFRFELFKCEKEVAAVLVPALEDKLEDCEGEVKGHHRLDLLIFNQEKGPLFVFFSSERNKENDMVIGPITMFLGHQYHASNGKNGNSIYRKIHSEP